MEVIGLMLFAAGLWHLYMRTYRTDDYLKLNKDRDDRLGRIGHGAGRLLEWWLRSRR